MADWDQFDAVKIANRLRAALSSGLPGRRAQRAMAHSLAYGRHHGPVPDDARRAAVLVALYPAEGGWSIPAIVRPESMKSHAGQVSLPGGLIEADETVTEAALREFEEELGAATSGIEIVGELTPAYVFVSGFQIIPIVGVSPNNLRFQPNPHEVAELIQFPLRELLDPRRRERHTIERRGLEFSVPHFAIGGQRVWGATSLILAEFAALFASAIGE
jgi:8-oxo-dGTP pyrophosphatase MutT (NUDIX family)